MPLGCKASWRLDPRLLVHRPLLYPREAAASARVYSSAKPTATDALPAETHAAKAGEAVELHPRLDLSQLAEKPGRNHGVRDSNLVEALEDCGRGRVTHHHSRKQQQPRLDLSELAEKPVRRHGVRDSILVEALEDYGHGRVTHYFRNQRHKSLTRQIIIGQKRDTKGLQPGDWRGTLDFLGTWTPQYDAETANGRVKIVIPPPAAGRLREDPHQNIWAIKSSSGALIKMLTRPDDFIELILEGEKTAVERAGSDILQLASDVYVSILPAEPASVAGHVVETVTRPAPVSAYRLEKSGRERIPYDAPGVAATDIPKPAKWCTRSLELYVADLTYGVLLPNWEQHDGGKSRSRFSVTLDLLSQVFEDPAAASCVSLSALKMALYFVVRAGEPHLAQIMALWHRAKDVGVRVDAEAFNLLAELHVKNKDLRGFQTTVWGMVKARVQPDLRTWILFLRMVEAEEVKRFVLHAMDDKGLFHIPGATKMAAECMAAKDAYRFIRQGQSLDEFRRDQKKLYGHDWNSRRAVRSVLDQLGRHGRFDDMKSLLDESFGRTDTVTAPDVYTLGIILQNCKLRSNLHAVTDFLAMFEKHDRHVMSPVVCQYLFDMAFQKKKPHTMDIVWRYACLVDMTTYHMRAKATRVLASGLKTKLGEGCRSLSAPPPVAIGKIALQAALGTRQPLVVDFRRAHGPEEQSIIDSQQAVMGMLAWYRELGKTKAPLHYISKLWAEAIALDTAGLKAVKEGRDFVFTPVALEHKTKVPDLGPGPGPWKPCQGP